MSDRDNPADRLAGINRSSDKKDFKQTITYAQSGNTVAGSVEGTTNPSSRKGAGKYGYTASSTETTDRNGDRYYKDQGKGLFEKGGALQRGLSRLNPFSKKETPIDLSGTGYRANDQTKIGLLASDQFIMSEPMIDKRTGKPVVDAQTGKPVYVDTKIERSEVQRYLKDGQKVTLFRNALLKGENGKTETYSAYEVTQTNDPSTFKFNRMDHTPGNRLRESGKGSVQLDGNGDLVTKTTGRNMTAGVKPEILGAAVNLSWFSQKDTAHIDLVRGKNGEAVPVSYTQTQKKVAVGGGLGATLLGAGPFAFVSVQGGKATGDVGRAYTDKLISPDGRSGERIARVQLALIYLDKDASASERATRIHSEVNDQYLGHARRRNHPGGSQTVDALDAYFAKGGTVKELEAVANSNKVSHDFDRSPFAQTLRAETAKQMILPKDVPLYHGSGISHNGHHYDAKAVSTAQKQSIDKIDGPRDDQPILSKMTRVLIPTPDGKKLKGAYIDRDDSGVQITKGVDSVIMSIDQKNINLNTASGNLIGVTITEIKGDHIGRTYTTTMKVPASLLPDLLHLPFVPHGHRDRPNTPNNPNDQKIPNVPPQECCPPGSPLIPHATPQQCCGGILGKLFGR